MPRKKKVDIQPIEDKPKIVKYTVIRDTQEKVGIWEFSCSKYCAGTKDESLDTGDYCIAGMEDIFSIERKASTGEIAGNVFTKQFENEMKRGDKLLHFYVVCEFSLKDVLNFPYSSGIPRGVWPKLKVTPQVLLKRIIELQIEHKVKFLFCNDAETAKEVARSIFKRMMEKYGDKAN